MANSLAPYELKSARLLWAWDTCAQLSSCQKKKNPENKKAPSSLEGEELDCSTRLSNSDLPKYWPVVKAEMIVEELEGRTSGTLHLA